MTAKKPLQLKVSIFVAEPLGSDNLLLALFRYGNKTMFAQNDNIIFFLVKQLYNHSHDIQ